MLSPDWGTRREAIALSGKVVIGIALVCVVGGCGGNSAGSTQENPNGAPIRLRR